MAIADALDELKDLSGAFHMVQKIFLASAKNPWYNNINTYLIFKEKRKDYGI